MHLHIGIDDTDSMKGGCTTYVAALLIMELDEGGYHFLDYPNIVRLNPNIPWKTRGNGAVCIRVSIPDEDYGRVREATLKMVEENADIEEPGTDPGVVLYSGELDGTMSEFSKKALLDVVSLREATKLVRAIGAEAFGYGTGRGIVGALAAIGYTFHEDYTFELLSYRDRENWGKPRRIDAESAMVMDREMAHSTFNNVDHETGRILLMPRGRDPVLCGVRGEDPESVRKAFEMLRIGEKISSWVIFKTNQGTDAHLIRKLKIKEVKPYIPVVVEGRVATKPKPIIGGHVIFQLADESGLVDCAAYEPTGSFRDIVRRLEVGDVARVYGGVRPASATYGQTINLEKVEVLRLIDKVVYENPMCPNCGRRMKSLGKGQGFRCDRCGQRERRAEKVPVRLPREPLMGLHIPPARVHRHLTKPYARYGREKDGKPCPLIKEWHYP